MKRVLLLVVAVGVLLIFMQPPLPETWSFQSKLIYIPEQFMDDSSIYGSITKKPSWPSWLLIATIIASLAAFTKTIPVQYIVELRLLYAVVVGITFGIYICAEYFIQTSILHAFACWSYDMRICLCGFYTLSFDIKPEVFTLGVCTPRCTSTCYVFVGRSVEVSECGKWRR